MNAPSTRTQVKRIARNASYDPALLHAIVDAAYVCHIAFTDEHGTHCIPTACWRGGEFLYIHGSNGSRMLKALTAGEACLTITHLDGLVLARSAFHHSMNYRSVVVHGRFETVPAAHKAAAMDRFMDHIAPGRRHEARPGDENELAATTVLRIPLAESSAKIRSGGPRDDEADMSRDVWAGVLPLVTACGAPQADGAEQRLEPDYVRAWSGSFA